jgi:hypothetical protein
MGKRVRVDKGELKAAKQAGLEHESALQRLRLSKRQLRKRQDQLKFRNGGIIEQAGLHDLPLVLITGVVFRMKALLDDPREKRMALALGKAMLAEQAARKKLAQAPREIFIAFEAPPTPPEDLRKTLKALKLSFKPKLMEWRGPADYTLVKRSVIAFGWDKRVIRFGYVS